MASTANCGWAQSRTIHSHWSRHLSFTISRMREGFDSETRLSWVLAALAGLIGAVAFTHSAGYFVTFMTGNTERAALGYFRDQTWLVITAVLLLAAFVGGVVVASLCRRHLWVAHPHGPTVLTALSLGAATAVCVAMHGWSATGDLYHRVHANRRIHLFSCRPPCPFEGVRSRTSISPFIAKKGPEEVELTASRSYCANTSVLASAAIARLVRS
jgi:hypothetical protein